GVDLDLFVRAPRPDRPDGLALRLLTVGRLHWEKGFEYALQALPLLRRAGLRLEYTIIGADQGALNSVRLAIRDFGLEDVVTLAGHLPRRRVRDALAAADIFLLPSLSEGSPIAVMEAMAMGLPVVVTDVGGNRELVADGVHGYVVPSRD